MGSPAKCSRRRYLAYWGHELHLRRGDLHPKLARLDLITCSGIFPFGGVARQTVSDNLKAGITRACFHEPMIEPYLRRSRPPLQNCHSASEAVSSEG